MGRCLAGGRRSGQTGPLAPFGASAFLLQLGVVGSRIVRLERDAGVASGLVLAAWGESLLAGTLTPTWPVSGSSGAFRAIGLRSSGSRRTRQFRPLPPPRALHRLS